MRRKTRRIEKRENKRGVRVVTIFVIFILILIAMTMAIITINLNKNKTTSENVTTAENYIEKTADGIQINTNKQLNSTKKVDEYTISNIQLTTQDGISTFIADVTNNSDTKSTAKKIRITLLDKNKTEIISVKGMINELEAGQTTQVNITLASDYINAYDFKAEVEKEGK